MRHFGLDHYASGECRKPPMYLPWLIGMVATSQRDTLHVEGRLTATRCTACSAAVLIGDFKNTYLDPPSRNSMTWGTAMHAFCEQFPAPGAFMEIRFPDEGVAAPKLGGMEIAGKMDYLPPLRRIEDLKCTNQISQEFKNPTGKWGKSWSPDMDTAVQLNIYRICKEQLGIGGEETVEEMIAWHAAMCSAAGPPPWIPETLPFLSEEQILDHKPAGGIYAVRDILGDYKAFNERRASGMPLDDNLRLVPLRGREMYRDRKTGVGQKCLKWCDKGTKGCCDWLHGIGSVEAQRWEEMQPTDPCAYDADIHAGPGRDSYGRWMSESAAE
jgi:hypothetical protein